MPQLPGNPDLATIAYVFVILIVLHLVSRATRRG